MSPLFDCAPVAMRKVGDSEAPWRAARRATASVAGSVHVSGADGGAAFAVGVLFAVP